MKTKIALGMAAVALGLVAIKSFSPVEAYQGDISQRGPNCTDERHSQMLEILKKGDYEGWKNLMDGRGVTRWVDTEAKFREFAEARLSGDQDKFDAFREKYRGQGRGMGQGMRGGYNR